MLDSTEYEEEIEMIQSAINEDEFEMIILNALLTIKNDSDYEVSDALYESIIKYT
tara:strand:- start:223 stop:387 length:165 start_codon:yes stop_codon:yes gene_type:complete